MNDLRPLLDLLQAQAQAQAPLPSCALTVKEAQIYV
jgi:hypothetical protein